MWPCLIFSITRYVWTVKWSNPGKEVVPSSTPRCSSLWKGSLRFTLHYGRLYICIYSCVFGKYGRSTDGVIVIYWPSTEQSIKRSTCVNKPKKSGSRRALRKNIDTVPAAVSQSETGMPKWESACRRLSPQWPPVEQLMPRCERSVAMVERRTWVNITVCPYLHSSLTHNRTSPFRK